MHAGDRPDTALRTMVREQRADVDAAEPVAVGEHEGRRVDVALHPADPTARSGEQPGLHAGDFPVLVADLVAEDRVVIALEVQREVREVLAVAQEVLLDVERPIAQAEHEAPEPEVVVGLHDVPQDRPPADVDQRLRHRVRDVPDPGTHTAAQDDDRNVGYRQILRHRASLTARLEEPMCPARIRGATERVRSNA